MTDQIGYDADFALFSKQYHLRIAGLLGLDFNDLCQSEAQYGNFLAQDYLIKLAAEERRTGRFDLMTSTERHLAAWIARQKDTDQP